MSLHQPAPRVSLRHELQYRKTYARENNYGQILNISSTGAFVTPLQNFAPGDEMVLSIQVSGRSRSISARVIWCEKGGGGVQFDTSNGQDRQIVEDLISLANEYRSRSQDILSMIFNKIS